MECYWVLHFFLWRFTTGSKGAGSTFFSGKYKTSGSSTFTFLKFLALGNLTLVRLVRFCLLQWAATSSMLHSSRDEDLFMNQKGSMKGGGKEKHLKSQCFSNFDSPFEVTILHFNLVGECFTLQATNLKLLLGNDTLWLGKHHHARPWIAWCSLPKFLHDRCLEQRCLAEKFPFLKILCICHKALRLGWDHFPFSVLQRWIWDGQQLFGTITTASDLSHTHFFDLYCQAISLSLDPLPICKAHVLQELAALQATIIVEWPNPAKGTNEVYSSLTIRCHVLVASNQNQKNDDEPWPTSPPSPKAQKLHSSLHPWWQRRLSYWKKTQ